MNRYSVGTGTESGFTLLEVSIVLLIAGLLFGSVLRPMGARLLERQRADTAQQLDRIREAIIGYASAHHRLPCALTQNGQTDCQLANGFVPAAGLGIAGQYNAQGLLIDSWGFPYQYHVSLSDVNNNGLPDYLTTGEMRDVGMQFLAPELEVCADAACNQYRANRLPVVLLSTGAKQSQSAAEDENLDLDRRFISRDLDTAGDDLFDDIVIWLSGNILYTRLLQAHVLP